MFPIEAKILLVDDSMMSLNLVREQLRSEGFNNVVEAKNGKEAIQLLLQNYEKKSPIQVVLSDLKMPETDGLQLLNFVRKSHFEPEIPFIMFSADGDQRVRRAVLEAGVSGFLLKPFSTQELMDKICEVWG